MTFLYFDIFGNTKYWLTLKINIQFDILEQYFYNKTIIHKGYLYVGIEVLKSITYTVDSFHLKVEHILWSLASSI